MANFARLLTPTGARYAKLAGSFWQLLSAAPWAGGMPTGEQLPADGARLLAPVEPSKILCVGRNYRAHAQELGHEVPAEPLLFFKPPSAVIASGDPIVLPQASQRVDHEAELGVVIGRRCRFLKLEEAMDVVFGYTCVNDVTARDLQKRDGQWARAKGFDSFCPVGPVISEGLDPRSLTVTGTVNGEVRQRGSCSSMIFPVAELLVYASAIFTLEPGDLLVTGTPEGVGPLANGDVVEVTIDGIGTLSNPVRAG